MLEDVEEYDTVVATKLLLTVPCPFVVCTCCVVVVEEEMVVGEDEERIKLDNRHRIASVAIKNPCFMFFQFVSRVACG